MDQALRRELLAMQAEDQALRSRAAPGSPGWDPEIDRRHTVRLKEIVREHGYPGRSLVGADGAFAAWLIAQHSGGDRDFQRAFLALMDVALAAGEAEGRTYAYLLDRVRLADGQPQVYGTQYLRDGDWIALRPVQDPDHLDERRRSIGLHRRTAEYLVWALAVEEAQRSFGLPQPSVSCVETAPGRWRATVSAAGVRVRVDVAWEADRFRGRVVGGPEREP